jgi:hypothetical protein
VLVILSLTLCIIVTALFCRLCCQYDCQLHNDIDKIPVRDNTQHILRAQTKPWKTQNPKCKFKHLVDVAKYANRIAARNAKRTADIAAAAAAAAANDSSDDISAKVIATKEINCNEKQTAELHSAQQLQDTLRSRVLLARLHMIFDSNIPAISLVLGISAHEVTALTV